MLRKTIFLLPILLLFFILVTIPTQATTQPVIQPANYCHACHSTGDSRLEDATAWSGGIEHNQISPCPAAKQINEEIYYTERLMLAIERARGHVPASTDISKSDSRFSATSQSYSRMLDAPVTSLEAFTAEAKMVRYQMGKSYSTTSQAIESAKRARVLWIAVGVSLIIAASLVWGWVNAQRALRTPHSKPKKGSSFYITRGLIFVLIFGFFTLPIFRLPFQEIETPSTEEQERQAALDETGRAALTADRELSRASILALIGQTWGQQNPTQGEIALGDALAAAQEAQNNTSALWGLSQHAREGSGVGETNQAKAALVASNLDSVRGRAWALRLIADVWMEQDEEQAETILENALSQTESATYPYAQLDLRAIAVSWARLDPEKGAATARRISDPALRSWAFREIAAISGDEGYFEAAVEAARQVQDPVQQARALRDAGTTSGDATLFDEAATALKPIEGAALAFALADLAAVAEDASLAEQISTEYPAAQALAYLGLGDHESAWDAAARIPDPFEKARAQAAIAGAWGNTVAAMQITNPLLRDRALRDVSLKTGNTALVADILDGYYQVQVLTAAGQFEDAWQIGQDLQDGYPLIALGTAWSESDPQGAIQIVDALDREADKAEVLRVVAAATGEQDDFERALDMALAARVRGDVLSPVQASINLAKAFASSPEQFDTAISQAFETALRINIIY